MLPICGLELDASKLEFGRFTLYRDSRQELESKFSLIPSDRAWSNTAISVQVHGEEVPSTNLCERCPRHRVIQTRMFTDPWGKPREAALTPHKQCICLSSDAQKKRIDVVDRCLPLLEDVLSLVRLMIHIHHHGSLPAHSLISLRRLPHYSEIVGIRDSKTGYLENMIPRTRMYGVPVRQKDVEKWVAEYQFDQLCDLVYACHTDGNVTDLQAIVISSLTQFGRMLEEVDLRDCFLRGATAVEALTGKAPGDKVSRKFREAGATLVVLGRYPALLNTPSLPLTREMRENWQDCHDKLKRIYEDRCDISHGSRRVGESEEDELYGAQQLLGEVAIGALSLYKIESASKNAYYAKLSWYLDRLR